MDNPRVGCAAPLLRLPTVDACAGDRVALCLECLVETRVSLLECCTIESHRDAGGDDDLVCGAVVAAVTEGNEFGLGGIDQFTQHFELGIEAGVIVNEFDGLGVVAHDVFVVL